MAKRLDKTVADIVVAGIMPALLIGMLTSLAFFLLELVLSGQHLGQMKYVLFFFIVAVVLIARISMHGEISERAALYGIILAIAAGLALVRFVEIPQSALGGFAWLVPVALMAVIWWSAHKLTLDSTWDDETDPDSTGGLLDRLPGEPTAQAKKPKKNQDWFDNYQSDRREEQKRRKPGTMIVYFSLAALPLFGLGQAILPAADVDRRRYAFWLLALYMACGLGMLLTTSFLGLRRYLRLRRLQMPAAMTGLWLALGCGLIVAILFLGNIIPRPDAEYSLSHLMGWAGSKERDANRVSVFEGSSGKSDRTGSGPGKNQKQAGKQEKKDSPQDRGDGQKGEAGNQGRQAQGQQGREKTETQGESQGRGGRGQDQSKQGSQQAQGGDQRGKNTQQQGKQAGQSQAGGKRHPEEGERENSENTDQPNPSKDASKGERKRDQEKSQAKNDRQSEKRDEGTSEQQQQTSSPEPPPSESGSSSWEWLRWVIYALMVLGAIYALIRWGKQLWQALLAIWREILAWCRGLVPAGARGDNLTEIPDPEAEIPPQPFAWFSNPLLSPERFRSMEEMIRYSFAALHSWAYEQNLGRDKGETPTEFVQRLGQARDEQRQEIRKLAELYSVVTYAGARAPNSSETILRNFWDRVSRSNVHRSD